MPERPEGGLWSSLRYTLGFVRGLWQRQAAVKSLREHIVTDTTALDALLGQLGSDVRQMGLTSRAISGENKTIDEVEARRERALQDLAEVSTRQAEEDGKFKEIEGERSSKVADAEAVLGTAEREIEVLEGKRRALREKRKTIERQQKGYLKAASEREEESSKHPMGDTRTLLRKAAEDLRRDAGALDPERQDIERRLAALERPLSEALAKVEGLKAELESSRRSLTDAREGHRQRLSELEAEQKLRKSEVTQAEADIQRRLVTLGTLVNLNRIDRPEFTPLYRKIDILRDAIATRGREIDRYSRERDQYDKGALLRGGCDHRGVCDFADHHDHFVVRPFMSNADVVARR